MTFRDADVLFCSKSGDENCERALAFLRERCGRVTVCMGDWGDALPREMLEWRGDYILSFMSKWIIPAPVLTCASIAAINFHPAPPSRPGASCANFALYDGDKEFGVTCHIMDEHVDAGEIIVKKTFPILDTDDVASLLKRTHDSLLDLFCEVVLLLAEGKNLPRDDSRWVRENFHTRKDLNEGLRKIDLDITKDELARRARATLFENWKPYLYLHGVKFEMTSPLPPSAAVPPLGGGLKIKKPPS